jgi:class 3 adenylate cyclase/tetratricopeptide (TPR) repeat protein
LLGKSFCAECGSPLPIHCPQCGAETSANAKFCADCGTALAGIARPNSDSSAIASSSAKAIPIRPEQGDALRTTDGERKTVTALFADIKGSTELMRDLDPEEARAVIDPVLQLMMDAVHRYDGYVVQSAGDGIFALFGAPVAHEDHPQRAVHAAIAMRNALRRRAGDLAGWPAVEIRIGINTGEVVLRLVHTGGHTEYTPVGHAANLAARMQSAAPAGGIIISEDTRRLVEGYFELRESGPAEVKGVAEPINVYEVIGAGALHGHFDLAVRRGLTKFLGREGELKQMGHLLELARDGHGQIVAVVAEAGTGKSRLFYEFKATLPAECKVLEAYSVSHGKASAWLPVLELLRGYFGIQEADDSAMRREKLHAALAALDPALSDTQSYLFALLAIMESPDPLAQMDPQVKRKRTLEALKRIVLREGVKQPIVIIFEDLHWIDDQTQALLDLLANSVSSARVLLLVNYRPEYRHEWGNKSYYSQLRLDALSRESAEEMLDGLLSMPLARSFAGEDKRGDEPRAGEGADLAALKRMIIGRTEGNPFFIEEMVQALFDQGALIRNGTVKVAPSLSQLRLPPTVQGLLASRIDQLPREHKELVQTLAVMGRESPLALIRKVATPPEGELEQMLAALQAGEFIYEAPVAAGVEYTFKHALTQEVAYNSLLIEQRKLLHERAGAALESLYAIQFDDHLSELAHHYELSSNTQKAIEYLQRAGQQAMQRSAHGNAIKLFTTASGLLETLPETPERLQQQLNVQLGLGVSFGATKHWSTPEVAQVLSRARELCRLLGDPPQLVSVLFGLQGFHLLGAELKTAHELASQLLAIGQAQQDVAVLLNVHFVLGGALYYMGEFIAAQTHFERVGVLYDPALHRSAVVYAGPDLAVHALCYQFYTLEILGYPDRAANRLQAAHNLARETSHPYGLALPFVLGACGYAWRRQGELALELAEEGCRLTTEQGFQGLLGVVLLARGAALMLQGQTEEGVRQLREALAANEALGMLLARTWELGLLADGCGRLGQVEEGLGLIAEALDFANETGEHYWEADLHRLKGELLLKRGAEDAESKIAEQAEACFRRAIEVARRQSAKSYELRATMSLTRLLAEQGKRDEAYTMLSEIYNWFTEGFGTPDLKDAKSLLNEL